ncbi:MAG: hypothetical protein A2W31_17255 [Planctomycetes bacterium RBG_16_64_10]|nr:MAG: hypothetical protein A2W31_17255 [Planctomycetes bacterium RBG_16_64_10]
MANAARVTTAKASVTINAAFLQEIKEVNEDLWRLLAETHAVCGQTGAKRSERRTLVGLLSRLRDQLAMHFALEEAFGYFEDPVTVAPHLCQRADALRTQHGPLYVAIRDTADRAEQLLYTGNRTDLLSHVVTLFQAFYNQLQEHEARENELILEAFHDDIGVGD